MRVAILSSEVVPFAKTGGLADVAGALPKALKQKGIDALVVLPLHEQINRHLLDTSPVDGVPVEWRGQVKPVRFCLSRGSKRVFRSLSNLRLRR